jgi:hypothetical protein
MRRKLAAAILAVGVLAAVAACGDDGGRSTEEICADLNAAVDPLETDLTSALQAAGLAAGQGDNQALVEAVADLNAIVTEVNTAVRSAADDTSDEQFRAALETFATELENLAGEISAGDVPDPQAVQAAGSGITQYCG